MRRLLITVLACGLLGVAVTARVPGAEATIEGSTKKVPDVNTSQDPAPNAKSPTEKPRLRFRSKTKSGIPKICGAAGMTEAEVREAEQKRLKEQAKQSNE